MMTKTKKKNKKTTSCKKYLTIFGHHTVQAKHERKKKKKIHDFRPGILLSFLMKCVHTLSVSRHVRARNKKKHF